MATTATVSVIGNAIVNRPVTIQVAIANTGVSAVNVTSIAPHLYPGGHTSITSQVFVPVGQAIASTTGMQNSIQVGPSATAYATFQVIAPSPTVQTGKPQQGGPTYQVSVDCALDDGTVFSAPYAPIPFAAPQPGRPQPAPNSTATTFGGALQFNQGANSALAL